MKPDISEFSYGYALTDELIHWHGTNMTAAPVFPSLYQEGQPGGGYDVMLRRPGLPLFLQFKLADRMVRKTAQEVKDGFFSIPYYRMSIRPARHSEQHEMLLDLESIGNEVYYSAPAFHTPEELNDAYLNHNVKTRSLWLRPSTIGPLPDDYDHYVAFTIPGVPHFCSEARPLNTKGDFDEFTRHIEIAFRRSRKEAISKPNLFETAKRIRIIAEKRSDISPELKQVSETALKQRHPLDVIAFYASVFMDCLFFIVNEKEMER
jgi:hypothetical protein